MANNMLPPTMRPTAALMPPGGVPAGALNIPAFNPALMPPDTNLGFQHWAQHPASNLKVQAAMTPPDAPLQPGANAPSGMAAVNSPKPAPMAAVTPPVVNPQDQARLEADQAKQRSLQASGAGLNKIHNGFLRGLAKIGDIAGTMISPGIMMSVPGTTMHNRVLQGDQARRIAQDQNVINSDLSAARTGVEAQNAADTSYALRHPAPKIMATDTGIVGVNPLSLQSTPVTDGAGNPLKPPQKTSSLRPEPVFDPATKQTVLANYNAATGTYTDQSGKPIANAQPMQKPMSATPHPGTSNGRNAFGFFVPGKGWVDANGAPLPDFEPLPTFAQTGYFEPTLTVDPTTHQLEPAIFDKRSGKLTPIPSGTGAALPSNVVAPLNSALETARGADTRLRVMQDNLADALKGDQQAMLSLLANHIGMTLGLQKGARITQAMYDEAQKSRPFLQGLKTKFDQNGYLTGVTLSKEQMNQMLGLARDRRDREWQQAKETASNYGVPLKIPALTEPRANVAGSGPANPGKPSANAAPPPGADVKVKGSDGKWYWGNSRTKQLLGVVQ